MKIKEIAKKYNLSEIGLEYFLQTNPPIRFKSTLLDKSIDDEDVPRAVELFREHQERQQKDIDAMRASDQQKKQIKEDLSKIKKEMILTTCPSIDGYTVEAQLGLVFGECILKASFSDSISAAFENFGASFSFSSTEMSGTMALLHQAREYTQDKMIAEAAERGANAIIGIDCESSAGGGGVMHISMFGTAVKVRKID